VVLYYLLVDWDVLVRRLDELIPRRWQAQAHALLSEVDRVLGEFLRGQLLVMLVLAAYYALALTLAGVEFALPLGVITGLLIFIPYVGFSLGLVLALLSALLQESGLAPLIAVAVIYGGGQLIESFVLTPWLVGDRIGLHPVAVIFALLAFGQLFGFVGLLLALPAAACVLVGLRALRRRYLASDLYQSS
jgi:predicted PurR-regulated permease PerM